MPSTVVRLTIAPLLLSALLAVPLGAAPHRISRADALDLPVLAEAGVDAAEPDSATPDRKVVGALWERLSQPGPARVIVVLDEGRLLARRDGDRAGAVATLAQRFVARAAGRGFVASGALTHFPIVFGEIDGRQLLALAGLPEVVAIQEDLPIHAKRVEGGALMKATQLRTQHNARGAGVGVAVIDSGVDNTHPELASRVTVQGDFTPAGGLGTDDGSGHGTAVAGIIAGTSGGVAPAAEIWAFKVLDDNGSGNSSWALASLDAAFANRNNFGGLDVINLSLGDSTSRNSHCDGLYPAETLVINKLVGAGIVVIAAAGNESRANGISGPACLSKVIAVGAVYDANLGSAQFTNCTDQVTAVDRVTCYSNSGAPLDLLAPSHCARTPKAGGGYESCFGGTSAASPYTAGVAAQILGLRPSTTPAQLQAALAATGKAITDPFTGLVRPRVEALAAYQALAGGGGPGGDPPPPATAPLVSSAYPGYHFWVRISDSRIGAQVTPCLPETVCVAGAIPTRAEVFVRIVGPKANGRLWPNVVKFNTTKTEVWIRQVSTGKTVYYGLPALSTDASELPGLVDKEGFSP